jgi:hypothetical protein
MWPQRGQPCQKQPSTKTTIRAVLKTKSGAPVNLAGLIRQPHVPARMSIARSRASVVRFPRPTIARMFALRSGANL